MAHLQRTEEVRCSSTAPAMAAPSEVEVPRPSSSSATCASQYGSRGLTEAQNPIWIFMNV